MSHCNYLTSYDIMELSEQLNAHPELWDQVTIRTTWEEGPFTETSDIWLRFGDDTETWGGPHFPVFYPAWDLLPALHPIVFDLMARIKATNLGGIWITRIPPGNSVKPHSDAGVWHAEFYPHKAYVIISGSNCTNRYEDEEYNLLPGESWIFNNLVTHSVENHGDTERIAAIVCMRTE